MQRDRNYTPIVGGFAESAILFQMIKDTFGQSYVYNVNQSSDPTFSVVKGAILCGQRENLIKPLLENMEDSVGILGPQLGQLKITESTDSLPIASVSDSTPFVSQHTASISQSTNTQSGKYLPPSPQSIISPM